ncbi:MAG: type IV secretion system protein [Phreatobacter sp.]|nr:type IV secretion system protein [Phreatobacter sp.]
MITAFRQGLTRGARLLFRAGAFAVAIGASSQQVLAGVSCNQLLGAGMNRSLASFGAAVSAAEGNWGSRNQYNCVGAFQFCPGTFERYYSGSREQFLNDPQGQVNAWTRYMQDQHRLATRNGLYAAVGRQACDGNRCVTVTESSILFACQFGCAGSGKLANYVRNGMQCVPGRPSPTNDGNGVCVAKYLVRGAGYDVSAVTGRQDAASGREACSGPAETPTTSPTGQPTTTTSPGLDANSRDPIADIPPELQGGRARMDIGPPTHCWLCAIAVSAMQGISISVDAGFSRLVPMVLPFLVMMASLSLVYRLGMDIVSGGSPQRTALSAIATLAVVFTVLQFGRDLILNTVIGGTIELGAGVGADLSKHTSTAMGIAPPSSGCAYDGVKVTAGGFDSATQALAEVACQVHMAGTTGMRVGGVLLDQKVSWWNIFDWLFIGAMLVLGIFLLFTSFMALVKFGGMLLESLIRIAVLSALSPLLIAAAMFPTLRPTFQQALRSLMYSFMLLVFIGIGATVMSFIMLMSMGLGLGLSATSSPDQIVEAFKALVAPISNSRSDWSKLGRFTLFTVAGFILAGQVMTAAQKIAKDLTSYAAGQPGEVAGAIPAAFGRLQTMAMTGVGLAASVGGVIGGVVGARALGAAGRGLTTGLEAAFSRLRSVGAKP